MSKNNDSFWQYIEDNLGFIVLELLIIAVLLMPLFGMVK